MPQLPEKRRSKTYRLWKTVEEQLEAKAKEMNLTPAKALNVLLSQALGTPIPSDQESEPDQYVHNPHPLDNHDAF